MGQSSGRPCLSYMRVTRVEVGPSEGNRSLDTTQSGESEGRIRAKTSGNGRHSDPSEQRRPVLV
jgi:hypothetical protein